MCQVKSVVIKLTQGGVNVDKRKVYTVSEIQSILGIGKNKAYELCTSGQFPYKRIGKSILVPKDSFDYWLNVA